MFSFLIFIPKGWTTFLQAGLEYTSGHVTILQRTLCNLRQLFSRESSVCSAQYTICSQKRLLHMKFCFSLLDLMVKLYLLTSLYLVEGLVWWTDQLLSDMTYNVFGGTLNPTLLLLIMVNTVTEFTTIHSCK